jgi:hypothetical protein
MTTHAWNFKKVMVLVRLLMNRQATWRSALVLATLLSERTPLQHPGVSVPLPVEYGRHGIRFEPTCSHVITAEASDTSNAANNATTGTSLFIIASIAHSFSNALVGARFANGVVAS